jgi:hypothetical protein
MNRLQDNPPMAGPAALTVVDFAVAYWKPRQGKSLGWDVCRRGVNYLLPMVLRLPLASKISAC